MQQPREARICSVQISAGNKRLVTAIINRKEIGKQEIQRLLFKKMFNQNISRFMGYTCASGRTRKGNGKMRAYIYKRPTASVSLVGFKLETFCWGSTRFPEDGNPDGHKVEKQTAEPLNTHVCLTVLQELLCVWRKWGWSCCTKKEQLETKRNLCE